MYWITVDTPRAPGLNVLSDGLKEFATQLRSASIVTPMNTDELIENGTAVQYDELVTRATAFIGDSYFYSNAFMCIYYRI